MTKIYDHLEKISTKDDHPVRECRKWGCKMPDPPKYSPPEPKAYTKDDHPVRMCKQFGCDAKSMMVW
jgi:hypothetical protein